MLADAVVNHLLVVGAFLLISLAFQILFWTAVISALRILFRGPRGPRGRRGPRG